MSAQLALKARQGTEHGTRKHDRILDAAEQIFADSGFDGAGMRQIAEQADVAQALIHYHFETKEGLLEAVVARRSNQINGERGRLLDALFENGRKPQLEDIIEALFRPTISVGHGADQKRNSFTRLLVSMANSADERSKKLAGGYYDAIALRFIDAIEKVVPEIDRKDAVWVYMFAIGVGMSMMAPTGRPGRLSGGLCDDGDIEQMLSVIVPFVCAGIRGVVADAANKSKLQTKTGRKNP